MERHPSSDSHDLDAAASWFPDDRPEEATAAAAGIRNPDGTAAVLPNEPFFVVIPGPSCLDADERAAYDSNEYSLRISEYLPAHETFADYLIDRSLEAWTRSQG